MGIVIVGLSHKTAPIEIRERVVFSKETLPSALKQLTQMDGITEGMILSTCNRVEVVAHTEIEDEAVDRLRQFLYEFHELAPPALDPFFYHFKADAAVRHVFRVASSLDSMVIGEPQILGQVKEAYGVAYEAGCVGSMLNFLMHRTFHVAKRVRHETGISNAAVSISYAAVELAKKIFDSLQNKTILIVGAGKMSELATKHLRRSGAGKVLVTNRTFERAQELAALFKGEAVRYENIFHALSLADIVICSTNAPNYVISRNDVQRALSLRRSRSMFFIDISVPRNVEPQVNDVDNVFAYDIDDLQGVVESNLKERHREAQAAEQLVEAEVAMFLDRLRHQDVGPIIAALKDRIESICFAELERHMRKKGVTDDGHRKDLEMMVTRIANKIVHPLIVQVRRQAGPAVRKDGYIETLTRVFQVHDKDKSDS
ncbi:MAG: glutamyl-tRNA reductase [Acidobacteria bacterium]|nr:glutamyl-tRNA reductase [Acidobacteriota bacterium]MBI3656445.1 glutamyl-tRNA reductase [Acidobacteriota bacterium]